MFSTWEIFRGNVLPPLIALAVLIVAAQPWRRGDQKRGAWGGPIAFGLAVLIALPALGIPFALMPVGVDGWIYHLAAAAMVLGVLEAVVKLPLWVWTIRTALIMLAAAWFMTISSVKRGWDTQQAAMWLGGMTTALTTWWLATEMLARRATGRWTALAMGFLGGGTGLLMLMTISIQFGRLGAVIGSTAGAAWIVTMILPRLELARGTALVVLVSSGAMVINDTFRYREATPLTPIMMALLWIAPLLSLLCVMVLTKLKPPLRWLIALLLLVIPIAIAVGLATPKFLDSIDESASDSYGEYGY